MLSLSSNRCRTPIGTEFPKHSRFLEAARIRPSSPGPVDRGDDVGCSAAISSADDDGPTEVVGANDECSRRIMETLMVTEQRVESDDIVSGCGQEAFG
jgi:hypothetical protein